MHAKYSKMECQPKETLAEFNTRHKSSRDIFHLATQFDCVIYISSDSTNTLFLEPNLDLDRRLVSVPSSAVSCTSQLSSKQVPSKLAHNAPRATNPSRRIRSSSAKTKQKQGPNQSQTKTQNPKPMLLFGTLRLCLCRVSMLLMQ